ncbi:glucose-1-phosphate cytidylyltransferase [Thalassospira sp.]|uniref:glucose-1-phosphate cytidylyltransferase n=1 Tax=Thalassospira sp. TaxID=1912094 RepID=UPI000C65F754|nr:glucose-1-phosphate cytidylyltransferase [Thalassospira sp.]MAL41054.1 glucose-1-phosphate cytidylyltransferase [Thalassospira sp.]|tara:strand:- start:56 stop:829 length:774 start_codon:yes stop_codon:yes gene_type:complete
MTKVVILAGGLGTRLAEETSLIPKPLVDIGGQPIIWHIMNIYSAYGLNEFIICAGYKAYQIKEYFANQILHHCDITVDLASNQIEYHHAIRPNWKITVVDTGLDSMTGGRIKRIREHLNDNEAFCLTYGDGVADVNIRDLLSFHEKHGLKATLTAVRPPSRFGALELSGNCVSSFREKMAGDAGYINGGFFVLHPDVIAEIENDYTIWEREPLNSLVRQQQLAAYKHEGFWQPMDTIREKQLLTELWLAGNAPWKVW